MADDALQHIYRTRQEGQNKYTYFLLAAAGASIAFAITQSQTATFNWAKLPLAVAILSWAFSFYAGCRQLGTVFSILMQNYDMLRIQQGTHPEFPNHPSVVATVQKLVRENADKSGRWGAWQFRSLLTGAFFYVVWHVTEMALRTPGIEVPYLS